MSAKFRCFFCEENIAHVICLFWHRTRHSSLVGELHKTSDISSLALDSPVITKYEAILPPRCNRSDFPAKAYLQVASCIAEEGLIPSKCNMSDTLLSLQ